MAKGNMEIFTFMVLNIRSLDLEMERKRKGSWSTQREFQRPVQLNPSLFNLQVIVYFEIFLVFTLQAQEVCCFILSFLFIALHFVLHCVFIMLFIICELLLLCSLCNVYAHHIAIVLN
jgi:hypothetical protein